MIPQGKRYLNSFGKEHVIAEHSAHLSQYEIERGNQGGKGLPDPDILPFCNWINSLGGICTLQSCAGHVARKGHGISTGCLWIWMDREYADLFRLRVYDLVQQPLMERVSQVFALWGEFADITFKGNESGQLDESLAALREFFEGLVVMRKKLWV